MALAPTAIETKRCYDCGLVKPVAAFAFHNKAKGTRQGRCRVCHARYRREHYVRNRDTYIRREVGRIKRNREQNRVLVREYLRTHACVDCGETDIVTLQFDHRDRSTKRTDVALLVVRTSWSIVLAEIAKCDVRCANCHRRRTALQLGWRLDRVLRAEAPRTPIIAKLLGEESGFRQCTGCGETKALEDFAYRDSGRGLRRARCRSCMREYSREHYRRNRVRYATGDWGRERCSRKELNQEIDEYLRSHPCVDCGESDPLVLDFDHRDGVDKLETVAFFRAKGRRDESFAEIDKCDVRCSNCHQRRTAKQFGWTKMLVAGG